MRGAVAAGFERGDGWSWWAAIVEWSVAEGKGWSVPRAAGGLIAVEWSLPPSRGTVSGYGRVNGRGSGGRCPGQREGQWPWEGVVSPLPPVRLPTEGWGASLAL